MQVQETHPAPRPEGAVKQRYISNFHLLQVGKLHCKRHKNAAAAGICVHCGLGICKNCMIAVGLKRYCRDDAERALRQTRALGKLPRRGLAITAASVLSYAEGIVASSVGFLFIILGLISPSMQQSASYSIVAQNFQYFSSVFAFPSITIIGLGAVIFALGLIYILTGTMLWRSSRVAGLVVVTMAIFGGLFGATYFAAFAVIGLLIYALVALAIANVGTVIAGWSHLR